MYGGDDGKLTILALILSAIGSGWAMLVLIPMYRLSRRLRPFTLSLTAAIGVSAAAVFVLKLALGRPRPCVALSGVRALCAMPTDPSFPSGHACGAFTIAAFLLVAGGAECAPLGRASVRVALVCTALGIAWSRVYLGVHFPIDVAAGALLGASMGAVGGALYRRRFAPHT
jgi:undecaprenyl-diphosphatase